MTSQDKNNPWRDALTALEGALHREDSIAALAQLDQRLDAPPGLPWLFRLHLDTLVRRGPKAGEPGPRELLRLALEAGDHGLLPVRTALDLARHLEHLGRQLRKAGAWREDVPLWWSPLPEAGELQESWRRLDDGEWIRVPSKERIRTALGHGQQRWLAMDGLLEEGLVRAVAEELETAHRAGTLSLEQGGVGRGRQSVRRSDHVLYTNGREPGLLAAAPHAAVLIQWYLDRWGRRLRSALGTGVWPPQRAMLARYPAPSAGYAPHLDNPGGTNHNGRLHTLVTYLNSPEEPCVGGAIALWPAGEKTTTPAGLTLPPRGGAAVLFDSRAVPHQVLPLEPGPARWAMTLWFNDSPQAPPEISIPRHPTVSEMLATVDEPPLPEGRVLFHELDDRETGGELLVRKAPAGRGEEEPRIGIVATVYGAGEGLEPWCRHHLASGADHLVLIFDHLEETAEEHTAKTLAKRFPEEQLTIWDGREVARRWRELPEDSRLEPVRRLAAMGGGSSYVVASRQSLNASVALADARGDTFGGRALDWLVHLDADELLWPQGRGRGGADLRQHFATLGAAGLRQVRYLDHELLPVTDGGPPRFKMNPRLAAARLGPAGWHALVEHLELRQTARRPWFHGYMNGKSAVSVPHAHLAAGVHGWYLHEPGPAHLLAGPSVLHFHYASGPSFALKYQRKARGGDPPGPLPFEPCPAEGAAMDRIRSLESRGAGPEKITAALEALHRDLTRFSPRDLELLEEAGVLLRPSLEHPLPVTLPRPSPS